MTRLEIAPFTIVGGLSKLDTKNLNWFSVSQHQINADIRQTKQKGRIIFKL